VFSCTFHMEKGMFMWFVDVEAVVVDSFEQGKLRVFDIWSFSLYTCFGTSV
jgi:hypothetical protein